MSPLRSENPDKRPALWLFAIIEMPYGATTGVTKMLLPFLLRQSGLSVSRIGLILAVISLPTTFCVLYSPIIDFWIRRRTWLLIVASGSAACSGLAIWRLGGAPVDTIRTLFFCATIFAVLVSAATGGLIGSVLQPSESARVGGWVQAGNLGAAALSGGVLLLLAARYSNHVVALAAAILILSPAFAGLAIFERIPAYARNSYGSRLRVLAGNLRETFSRKQNIPSLLLLLAPIGTGAMSTLMSGMTREYAATLPQLAIARGFGGGLLTAAGAMCAVLLPTRMNPNLLYASTAFLYGIVCLAVAAGPLHPVTLIVGLLLSNFARGLSFACYTGVVLQIMGTGGEGNSTRYMLLNSIGNIAVIYMTWIAGVVVGRFGTRSLGAFDGLTNILVALAFICWWTFWRRKNSYMVDADTVSA